MLIRADVAGESLAVRHVGAVTVQLAEVAVSEPMIHAIIAAIQRLRAPPAAT